MCNVLFELKPYPTPQHIPKPVMPIVFKNPSDESKVFSTIGLVDSGADESTLPLEAQLTLGLDLAKMGAQQRMMSCACGNKKFSGYRYKLKVVVKDTNGKPIERFLWTLFGGTNTMPLIGRNLMDIFEKVEYDNSKKRGYFVGLRKTDE